MVMKSVEDSSAEMKTTDMKPDFINAVYSYRTKLYGVSSFKQKKATIS